jgi:hypothetical protein
MPGIHHATSGSIPPARARTGAPPPPSKQIHNWPDGEHRPAISALDGEIESRRLEEGTAAIDDGQQRFNHRLKSSFCSQRMPSYMRERAHAKRTPAPGGRLGHCTFLGGLTCSGTLCFWRSQLSLRRPRGQSRSRVWHHFHVWGAGSYLRLDSSDRPQKLGVKSWVDSPESVGILRPMKSLSDYSLVDLRRVMAIKEKLLALNGELEAITGEVAAANPTEAPAPTKRTKRKLSVAHRRKLIKALARARKARWAKAKAAGTASAPKKRRISKAGRAAISAAAKARWAKVRAAKAA